MVILCLCREDNLTKILADYAREIRSRGIEFVCVGWGTPLNCPLEDLLHLCSETPSVILHPESDFLLLPAGLAQTSIPTLAFQVDTYAFLQHRLMFSALFDHVAVFHPGYAEKFRRYGHLGAFLLPHAVRRELHEGRTEDRCFDVGWVGQTRGQIYRKRLDILQELARNFKMNDWTRFFSAEEMADVYCRSRIVVNIGRDDYPQDANLRTFEAMASGALLITSLPSELGDLGFAEGTHFAGYRRESELVPLVRRFLQDESERSRIASAGQKKVLQEHTYERRVDQLIDHLEKEGSRKLAPARQWPKARVHLSYLDYFATNGVLDCAEDQLRQIVGGGLRETWAGTALMGRAWARKIQGRMREKWGAA